MARKKITRTRTASIRTDASPRHLWLAGLGMAVIAGRESMAAVSGAAQRVALVRKQAIAAVGQAQSNVRSTVADLRSQIETGAGEIVGKLESTAQPLIAKFKPTKAKRAVRRGRPPGSKNVRRAVKQTEAKKTVRRSRKA
jgi:hypothetical protein